MSKKRMANVQSGHHNFFFSVCPRTKYILLYWKYLIYFPGTHPTQTATVLILGKGENIFDIAETYMFLTYQLKIS